MFTGIIESLGRVEGIHAKDGNISFQIACDFIHELQEGQSISHDGVCLTVERIENRYYVVTAINETLERTNLSSLKLNSYLNLERCMKANGRFDGHIVQGHVDASGLITGIENKSGSTEFNFEISKNHSNLIVEKGSICINGVSLTITNVTSQTFGVAIVPYTLEHTTFKYLQNGDKVNIEYDIIGKYVNRITETNSESLTT